MKQTMSAFEIDCLASMFNWLHADFCRVIITGRGVFFGGLTLGSFGGHNSRVISQRRNKVCWMWEGHLDFLGFLWGHFEFLGTLVHFK